MGRDGQNRAPKVAPRILLQLSKTTLADLVWELSAVSPGCTSCDDAREVWRAIESAAANLASTADKRKIKKAIERVVAVASAKESAS